MRSFVVLAALCAASVAGATPYEFHHQGHLVDASGQPVSGSTNLTFAIYPTASATVADWTETHSNVPLDGGYYAVELGSVVPFPEDLFGAGPWWLQVSTSAGPMPGRTQILPVPIARTSQAVELASAPPVSCTQPQHYGRMYYDTTMQKFRGCDSGGWGSLGGGGADLPVNGTGTQENPGRSCLDIHTNHPSLGDGLYHIDPDGDGLTVQVLCDMTRDGGGWTFYSKHWYQSGIFGNTGAVGGVVDALTLKSNTYKLSDDLIRTLAGPRSNFDVMMDQAGYQSATSNGNFEYVVLSNYTAFYRSDALVLHSSTPTTMRSFRLSDHAVVWTGDLACGEAGGAQGAGKGINCNHVSRGDNPGGGSRCSPALGLPAGYNDGSHQFYQGESNSDTYLYICNGSQHSSSYPMNHRMWIREHANPYPNGVTIGTQSNPGRTCKDIHTQAATLPTGVYWINPDNAGAPVQVQCNMTYDGGGWTLGLKSYHSAGVHGTTGAVGNVADALTIKQTPYKLSDAEINQIIGPSQNFDVMGDQAGYQSAESVGNREYVVLRNYTGNWTFGSLMPESTTTTSMTSFRITDHAQAWTGRLVCGTGVQSFARGINCRNPAAGSSDPAAGPGCTINLGLRTIADTSHFFMSDGNGDTYLYICNGDQHSSSYTMSHRWWFRERN